MNVTFIIVAPTLGHNVSDSVQAQRMVRHGLQYELGASSLGSIHEAAHYNPPMLSQYLDCTVCGCGGLVSAAALLAIFFWMYSGCRLSI